MRQIVLDTETTGLEPTLGHRIIEVAAVELVNRRLTGNHFHRYLNPEREIDEGAQQVHGLTLDFLADKPRFADIVEEFLAFIRDAELIIHNAPFDVGFLNHELALLGLEPLERYCVGVVDTLRMARDMHPGQKNNLDALCKRYGVDNSNRTLHGALLDAELLAEVYLALTRGQDSLMIELNAPAACPDALQAWASDAPLIVLHATEDELAAHEALLAELDKESKGACLWRAASAT
ncbi:DNA polymerase III subunit epsilon [Thiobacter aerophilum]|uniref:DNA polymerase III subunit epsilon n=1 Tax=Thiobacter aerophilum TaxID=3121275 RepID=A0ABV0EBV1_9BURK